MLHRLSLEALTKTQPEALGSAFVRRAVFIDAMIKHARPPLGGPCL
jgi:hypothetical protein